MSGWRSGYDNKNRTRGGRGEFTWDSLKGDRKAAAGEFYLGRSQACEDIWYSRTSGTKRKVDLDELKDVKQQEEDMMRQALGLQPVKRRHIEMTEKEQEAALRRDGDAAADNNGPGAAPDALGLGLNKAATKASVQFMQNHGVENAHLIRGQQGAMAEEEPVAVPTDDAAPADADVLARTAVAFENEDGVRDADGYDFAKAQELLKRKALEKQLKKLKKKEKKEKKKKKKKDKKKKKSKKKRSRRSSSSSSDSSSDDSSDSS